MRAEGDIRLVEAIRQFCDYLVFENKAVLLSDTSDGSLEKYKDIKPTEHTSAYRIDCFGFPVDMRMEFDKRIMRGRVIFDTERDEKIAIIFHSKCDVYHCNSGTCKAIPACKQNCIKQENKFAKPKVESLLCNGCKDCVGYCQSGALVLSSKNLRLLFNAYPDIRLLFRRLKPYYSHTLRSELLKDIKVAPEIKDDNRSSLVIAFEKLVKTQAEDGSQDLLKAMAESCNKLMGSTGKKRVLRKKKELVSEKKTV